jgi:hypothetical protein
VQHVVLKNLIVAQLLNKFLTFYETHVHESPLLDPNVSHLNPVQTLIFHYALSVCLLVYLSACLSIYLYIYLYIPVAPTWSIGHP